MGGEVESIGIAEARSALAWWLEAGVDVAVQEEPRDWLKPADRARDRPRRSRCRAPNVVRAQLTRRLPSFSDWLASSAQLPLASATARAVLPHGPEDAAIMLLSDAPTLEDFAAGQPIGGEAWELAEADARRDRDRRRPGLQRVARPASMRPARG